MSKPAIERHTVAAERAFKKSGAQKRVAKPTPAKPVMLSGGDTQIAKAEGDASVQVYIKAMLGWKRESVSRTSHGGE